MSETTYPTEEAGRWSITIRRNGRTVLRVTLPTLSDALEAARVDAAWLAGVGTVHISQTEAKG